MRSPIRNTLFVGACLVLCLLALCHKAAMVTGIVPVTANSFLEGRAYQRLPRPSLESITDGSFQDEIEQYLADSIPARDEVILLNARVQGMQIGLANCLFRFPAYPTFYGSNHAYVPSHDAVVETLGNYDKVADSYRAPHETLQDFAERHPDLNIFVLEVDEPRTSSANPTHGLLSHPSGTQVVHDVLLDSLPGNVTLVEHDSETPEKLFKDFYRTDHHWQVNEGYQRYVESLSAMRPDEQPAPILDKRTFDVQFYGSLSRSGLFLAQEPDSLVDYRTDLPELVIHGGNGKLKRLSYDALDSWERYEQGVEKQDRFENTYADYFHGDYGLLRLDNPAATTQDSLLLVGNSYLNCMERFYAYNYAHVYKVDGRHTSVSADELLERHPEIEDVLIVGQPSVITSGSLAESE